MSEREDVRKLDRHLVRTLSRHAVAMATAPSGAHLRLVRLTGGRRRVAASHFFGEAEFMVLVTAGYTGMLAAVCAVRALDFLDVNRLLARRGENTLERDWLAASEARAWAMYLLNTLGNMPQRLIARAVGLDPAAVAKALARIEALRDRPEVERELNRIERALNPQGAA